MTVHGRSTVHSSGTRSRASGAASGVRRDVGRANEAAVLSGGVLRLAQREVVHVELIGHVCDIFTRRVEKLIGLGVGDCWDKACSD